MMVDPNVHFHVIPRYSQPHRWRDLELADAGWPGPPDLKSAVALDEGQICALSEDLRALF
jgi:diadenosine tetraphosphate (Ap4A) HIT family hydrolase